MAVKFHLPDGSTTDIVALTLNNQAYFVQSGSFLAAAPSVNMTRVAGANARIWVDIFLDNRDALLDGLRRGHANEARQRVGGRGPGVHGSRRRRLRALRA